MSAGFQIKSRPTDGSIINSAQSPNNCKIFVGGISKHTNTDSLRQYFEKYGEISDVDIKIDAMTQASRGFGFILFAEQESINRLENDRTQHHLDGKRIDPKRAEKRNAKIFVGGLKSDFDDDSIQATFAAIGEIELYERRLDKNTGRKQPFCFITFKDDQVASRLCREHWFVVEGKRCEIKSAVENKEKKIAAGTWGRGGGHMGAGAGNQNFGYGNNVGNQSGYGTFGGTSYGNNAGGGAWGAGSGPAGGVAYGTVGYAQQPAAGFGEQQTSFNGFGNTGAAQQSYGQQGYGNLSGGYGTEQNGFSTMGGMGAQNSFGGGQNGSFGGGQAGSFGGGQTGSFGGGQSGSFGGAPGGGSFGGNQNNFGQRGGGGMANRGGGGRGGASRGRGGGGFVGRGGGRGGAVRGARGGSGRGRPTPY